MLLKQLLLLEIKFLFLGWTQIEEEEIVKMDIIMEDEASMAFLLYGYIIRSLINKYYFLIIIFDIYQYNSK